MFVLVTRLVRKPQAVFTLQRSLDSVSVDKVIVSLRCGIFQFQGSVFRCLDEAIGVPDGAPAAGIVAV
jgi:hypothetical protein